MEETKVYLPCGHSAKHFIPEEESVKYDGYDCLHCFEEWLWISEAPLREVESGRALEKWYDYLSSFDDPRSF